MEAGATEETKLPSKVLSEVKKEKYPGFPLFLPSNSLLVLPVGPTQAEAN